jgi:hypothetical protein
MTLQKLDLREIVPFLPGVTVFLKYKFADKYGEGLRFRTPDDPNPVSISAPARQG